jgi:hypothetical protein
MMLNCGACTVASNCYWENPATKLMTTMAIALGSLDLSHHPIHCLLLSRVLLRGCSLHYEHPLLGSEAHPVQSHEGDTVR